MDYTEFIKMGGVSGNIRGARAAELLRLHRAHAAAARDDHPLGPGEVYCSGCHAVGRRIGFDRYRCRGCDHVVNHTGVVVA
jgi:hypothetical protein